MHTIDLPLCSVNIFTLWPGRTGSTLVGGVIVLTGFARPCFSLPELVRLSFACWAPILFKGLLPQKRLFALTSLHFSLVLTWRISNIVLLLILKAKYPRFRLEIRQKHKKGFLHKLAPSVAMLKFHSEAVNFNRRFVITWHRKNVNKDMWCVILTADNGEVSPQYWRKSKTQGFFLQSFYLHFDS